MDKLIADCQCLTMEVHKKSPGARRLTREDWVGFARRILVKSGIDNVKVDRLAKQAKVTRGSFYWHFKDRQDLLDALLRDWEVRNHVEVASIRDRWAREEPDLSDLIVIWLGEDRSYLDFDMAIRSWARRSQTVADAIWRVDAAWIALIEELFRIAGYEGDVGLVRARIAYFHQIGYHALAFREDRDERLRLVPEYYRVLTGREPSEKLMNDLREISKRQNGRTRPG